MADVALIVWAFAGPGVGFGLALLVLMRVRALPSMRASEADHVETPLEVSAPSDLVSLVGELDRARHHGGSE